MNENKPIYNIRVYGFGSFGNIDWNMSVEERADRIDIIHINPTGKVSTIYSGNNPPEYYYQFYLSTNNLDEGFEEIIDYVSKIASEPLLAEKLRARIERIKKELNVK